MLNMTSDLKGQVMDGNGTVVGRIDGIDPMRQMVLVQRLNMFDDLLRAVQLLRMHTGKLPPMIEMDIVGTLEEAIKYK